MFPIFGAFTVGALAVLVLGASPLFGLPLFRTTPLNRAHLKLYYICTDKTGF